jgi:hypothetical protein
VNAASTGNIETVRLLLADPRTNTAIRNRPARLTARNMATALGFTAIAELIGQRQGDTDNLSPRDAYVERDVGEPQPVAPMQYGRRTDTLDARLLGVLGDMKSLEKMQLQ